MDGLRYNMDGSSKVVKKDILGKKVYVFEDHAFALIAWAQIRQTQGMAPILITLDNHSDSRTAFVAHSSNIRDDEKESLAEFSDKLTGIIHYSDENSVSHAVENLRNDEHIDAAIGSGIIKNAFIIGNGNFESTTSVEEDESFASSGFAAMVQGVESKQIPPHPHTYEATLNGIYKVRLQCVSGCLEINHDSEECQRALADQAIESDFLNRSVRLASEMSKAIGIETILESKYVLDIDLDYFMTRKAIVPENVDTFYGMIRQALAITIAMEPDFVEEGQIENEELTSEWLLKHLLEHIHIALS